ncbi:MAG TPA: tRNA pseudouridine(38-40) synthase TruA, partial [Firmicutes bacterium]|nr:tRNA pseudouridine(38-40) synthase TruA [Bacillota bacterium]
MPNFKVILSYDGTNYSGFQWQLNAPTIQGKVEEALKKIYGRRIAVIGAGRTDSGVHARGQVINFHADRRVPAARMPYALQGLLPRDIVARDCEEVDATFNARASAREKVYCYTLDTSPYPDVFLRRYAYHYTRPLNLEA